MKKYIVLVVLVFLSKFSFSQLVSGTLVDDQRKMTSVFDFKIKGKYIGVKYFELAVNNEGIVTSIKEVTKSNSLASTPAAIVGRAELKKLTFEKGTRYPKFHQVLVKVEYVKG